MPRPRSISNEHILEAARAVFLEHGYAAPTSLIAKQAGISEGTIFQRFSTKADLFQSAMGIETQPAWLDSIAELDLAQPHHALEGLAEAIFHFFHHVMPRMIMMMNSGTTPFELFRDNPDSMPTRAIRALTELFTRLEAGGVALHAQPRALARIFLGSIHHVAFAELSGINAHLDTPRQDLLAQLVALILGPRDAT